MDLSSFISPDPATRHDGWSPERQGRFLNGLAACGSVRAACGAAGMSRDAAYTLRRRDALFARGWAAALVLARENSVELLADKATEGIEEEIWHRGELVGTKRRFDARLFLAHVARLDRMVEENGAAARDAARFDEIHACIAGADVPEPFEVEDKPLPLDRETAIAMADEMAREAVGESWEERRLQKTNRRLSAEERAVIAREMAAEGTRARLDAAAQWDIWFDRACNAADDLLGRPNKPPLPGLAGNPLPAPPVVGQKPGCGPLAEFSLRTVSEVSVSALARALAGPAQGFAGPPRSPFQAPRAR
jgi:hypothetical protein